MFALKYALVSIARRKQKNIITAIAIALGVALFIGTQAATNGIYDTITKLNLENVGNEDISINNPASINGMFNGSVDNFIENQIPNDPVLEHIVSVSSRVSYYTSVYANETGLLEQNVGIHGINPSDSGFGSFYDLSGNKFENLNDLTGNSVIISDTLAKELELEIGSVIQINVPNGLGNSTTIQLSVSHIYEDAKGRGQIGAVGESPVPQLYINILTLQSNFNPIFHNFVTDIKLTLEGIDRSINNFDIRAKTFPGKSEINAVVDRLSELFSTDYPELLVSSPIVQIADTTLENLVGISSVLTLFAIILNGVALLLIINIQSMAVDDRKSQTAILRALGSKVSTIFSVFLIESVIIGIVGAFVGLLLGMLISVWILDILSTIFLVSIGSSFSYGLIITSMSAGIILSVVTAVFPSLQAARQSIANSLRGIESDKKEKKGYWTIVFGFILLPLGLLFATQVGDLTKDSTWSNLDDQITISLGFGLTLAGIGLILTLFVSRRVALSISGISLFGLGVFFFSWAISKGKTGNGGNLFSVILMYMIIGSTIVVSVYYEEILQGISKLIFTVSGLRAIGQVTTRSMIGKKNRGILVYTILAVILVLTIFIASAAETQRYSVVDSYEKRSYGVDVVISTDAKVQGTRDRIASINERNKEIAQVSDVYGFRRAYMPIYLSNPLDDNFDIGKDVTYLPVVEVPESVINSDNWGDHSLPFQFFDLSNDVSHEIGQTVSIKSTDAEHHKITTSTFDLFYNNFTREKSVEFSINGVKSNFPEVQQMIIGGYGLQFMSLLLVTGGSIYLQGVNGDIMPMFIGATTAFDMLGDAAFPLYSNAIMVTPQMASRLAFDSPNQNLFLVKSENTYSDKTNNELLAKAIEQDINNLNDPNSFSSKQTPAILVGASSSIVKEVVREFFFQQAAFWDFLGAFSTLGLVIGTLGMMIIAVRSVTERTREIGMMRSIGFNRKSVVYGVLIEMLVLSIMSLIVGVSIAIIFSESFASNVLGVKALYPMGQTFGYIFGLLGLAVVSGVVPGYRASQVLPSHALRYTG